MKYRYTNNKIRRIIWNRASVVDIYIYFSNIYISLKIEEYQDVYNSITRDANYNILLLHLSSDSDTPITSSNIKSIN